MLAKLSDDQLRQTLRHLAVRDRLHILELSFHLAEVEARQLHLRWGFSSLWDYCGRELLLKDGVAHLRITLARLVARRPELRALLLEGRLGLCTACELWSHVEDSDFSELVQAALGMSKNVFRDFLAGRSAAPAPKRDVIRRLGRGPEVKPTFPALKLDENDSLTACPINAVPANAVEAATKGTASQTAATLLMLQTNGVAASSATSAMPPLPQTSETQVPTPTATSATPPMLQTNETQVPAKTATSATPPMLQTNGAQVPASSATKTHRITFSATDDDVAMLRRLQDLLGTNDVGEIVRASFDKLLDAKDERRRMARRQQRQARNARASAKPKKEQSADDSKKAPRRPSAAMADAIKVRDEGLCTFVAPDGTRCNARRFQQIDHVTPYACGGSSTDPRNLRTMCKNHNIVLAREVFGDRVPRRCSV